jgi:hypothetical protein
MAWISEYFMRIETWGRLMFYTESFAGVIIEPYSSCIVMQLTKFGFPLSLNVSSPPARLYTCFSHSWGRWTVLWARYWPPDLKTNFCLFHLQCWQHSLAWILPYYIFFSFEFKMTFYFKFENKGKILSFIWVNKSGTKFEIMNCVQKSYIVITVDINRLCMSPLLVFHQKS